ncbi:Arginyl-tRNA--protein transferase 1 [Bonamia ostreae]|uniref:Arginyl-tRNA--protein transferase 1 n=1 Tax=Bonamia ostreae TaxID=126728 RepID=A0ABV2AN54_9EUKA
MFYVTTDSLSPADYQKFADAGFVRSGNLLYLVCPSSSCCPAYPMRLDVRDFKASRSQRKVLNRFGKYTNPTKTSENSHIRKTDFRKLNQILSKENGIYPQIRKFVVAKLEFLNCYEGFEDFVVGDENWDVSNFLTIKIFYKKAKSAQQKIKLYHNKSAH